ncbi:CoA transferase [Paraburkholderia sp. LEh10]|uniref:CoA transferase n=1 Tax=Paraburkholderia sp. LEh10 TaxID=2821353 RepID=UPI001AE68C22|nr:CoA transferase [Paraburkholderia sp. LEh10]MBP0594156.1 CoA transferase [Paraburkholderia sp. LEh10]
MTHIDSSSAAAHATTASIENALRERVAEDIPFDLHAHLKRTLAVFGIDPASTGGSITFEGADPIVPSVFRLGAAAGLALMTKSVAMAALWAKRTGEGQDLHLDIRKAPRRLCPFWERKWELLNGYAPRNTADPTNPFMRAFFETRDGRWMMPFNLYPRLRSSALRLLQSTDDPASVAAAFRKWDARELEEAGSAAGVVMPMVRSAQEFMQEKQYIDHLSSMPLVQIEKIGDSDPEPFTNDPITPLDGVRVLGMARVIAGAAIGRALAYHGADVLNVWRPDDFEVDTMYTTANVGVRSTLIDVGSNEGNAHIKELLRGADIFYANRRHGFLDKVGLTAEEAAQLRPGIIHVTVSLHGETGPWAARAGFDQTAGAVTGITTLEGTPDAPQLPPVMVVNDNMVAWLATTGALAALMRRAEEGGSYRVHVSLSRASLWLYSLGLFDKTFAHETAGSSSMHENAKPDLFTAETSAGRYQGVTDQVRMSRTPGHYATVLVPRGSSMPAWLAKR